MYRILLGLIGIVLVTEVFASVEAISVTDATQKIPLAEHLLYLEDSSGKLTIREVSAMALSRPKRRDGYYGISDSSFWFKFLFRYESQSELKSEFLLELEYPVYPVSTLYIQQRDGSFSRLELGQQAGFEARPIKYRNPVFPILLERGKTQTVYLNIKREGDIVIAPLTLWSPRSLSEKSNTENLYYGLFYGALAVLFLYNLFLWFSIRDSEYTIYLWYLASVFLFCFVDNGLAFQYSWPRILSNHEAQLSFGLLSQAAFAEFGRRYIHVPKYSVILDRVYQAFISGCFFLILVTYLSGEGFRLALNDFLAIYFSFLVVFFLIVVVYCVYQGSREAKFIAWASFSMVFAAGAHSLFLYNIIPLSFLTIHGLQLAVVIEAILLSIALADKINKANARIKRQDDLYRVKLEQEVRSRTAELAESKKIAEKANHAKSAFIAAASHDLRQPLQAIVMNIFSLKALVQNQLHRMKDYPESRRKEVDLVDNLEKSATSLTIQLDGILNISKLEAGVIQPEIGYFQISALIESLVDQYRPLAQSKCIDLQFLDEQPGCQIATDAVLLDRILQNLIVNAIKYTDTGFINIKLLRPDKEKLLICVQDSGMGIPSDKLESIFEEFFQIQNPERDPSKGLGLGLATAKHLCKLLSIPISVESQQGQGSSFYLHINDPGVPFFEVTPEQCSLAVEAIGSQFQSDADSLDLNGKQILIVDDDNAVAQSVASVLEDWNCEVSVCHDYYTVIQCKKQFDIAILDYRLPDDKTGLQVADMLRQRCAGISILIVTGDTGPKQLQELNSSGYAFLSKPIGPDKLKLFLRSCV